MKAVLTLLENDELAEKLDDIAAVLCETAAMPRAAEGFMVTHGYAVKRYSESWRVCRRG